jgi:ribonuclease E
LLDSPVDEVMADEETGIVEVDERYEAEEFEPEDFDEDFPSRHGGRDREGDRGRGGRDRGRGGRDRGGDRRRRMGGGRPGAGRPKPPIQDIFKRGQEVIVQVIKEGLGTKGPTLSTYISIPGRYLVLMPGLNRTGVSRKIQDDEQRRRLRDLFNELKPPRGVGFIMRTAAIDKNKKDVQRDLAYLTRLWQVVAKRVRKLKAPAEIFQESDIVTRTLRDSFNSDIESITIDAQAAYEAAQEFMQIVMPRYAGRLKFYDGKDPLFHKAGIEEEIHKLQQKKVPLPNGGSIVIEQTEALVAIDVNSGNFRADRYDAEETAYQLNLQAAKEIARQLRLRDLTGIIVNDFIDMRDEKHRRAVEKAVRDACKRDRARTKILKTSAFGIIEMTRQRTRDSLKKSVYTECPYCKGMSHVKTCESMSLEVIRLVQLAAFREHVKRVQVRVSADVADYLQNNKRREIGRFEEEGGITVHIDAAHDVPPELLEFTCYDNNGNEVKVLPPQDTAPPRRR